MIKPNTSRPCHNSLSLSLFLWSPHLSTVTLPLTNQTSFPPLYTNPSSSPTLHTTQQLQRVDLDLSSPRYLVSMYPRCFLPSLCITVTQLEKVGREVRTITALPGQKEKYNKRENYLNFPPHPYPQAPKQLLAGLVPIPRILLSESANSSWWLPYFVPYPSNSLNMSTSPAF